MKRTLLALALGATTIGAVAGQAEKPVNVRQLNQERRIDAGVRSGKLSPHEAARLKGQQASIRADEAHRRAVHGGHLTAHDKRLIHARQDSANAMILKKKNNAVRGKDHLKL
jgi:hypothetical protein